MNLYATIFADSTIAADDFRVQLARILGGAVVQFEVTASSFEISVRRNSEFVPAPERSGEDDFLFFRYRLEVVPRDDAPSHDVIAEVAVLLEALWSSGSAAVAACDYEHLLPRNGGIGYLYGR